MARVDRFYCNNTVQFYVDIVFVHGGDCWKGCWENKFYIETYFQHLIKEAGF